MFCVCSSLRQPGERVEQPGPDLGGGMGVPQSPGAPGEHGRRALQPVSVRHR